MSTLSKPTKALMMSNIIGGMLASGHFVQHGDCGTTYVTDKEQEQMILDARAIVEQIEEEMKGME